MAELSTIRRIVFLGVTGSGKTTAAHIVGRVLGLPVFDANAMQWEPSWQGVPYVDQAEAFGRVLALSAWVLDDPGPDTMACAVADLVILLDYPRWVSLQRLLRRSLRRVMLHTEICNGNYESWGRLISRDSIIAWHFRSWAKRQQEIAEIRDRYGEKTLLARRPRELRAWLDSLGNISRKAGL